MSSVIQNEISAQITREKLVQWINASGCFSLLADESMDISTTEQVSLCARYVAIDDFGKATINEHFLCFVPIVDQTADNVTRVILQTTARLGLNMDLLVGQGYDGASTFSGCRNGVAVQIKSKFPKACYVHCASHKLNLAINRAMDVQMVKNALSVVHEITKFFQNSAYTNDVLKNSIKVYMPDCKKTRLIGLCQTRFIERHDALSNFVELLECIYESLVEISQSKKPSSSAAAAFLASIEKSES